MKSVQLICLFVSIYGVSVLLNFEVVPINYVFAGQDGYNFQCQKTVQDSISNSNTCKAATPISSSNTFSPIHARPENSSSSVSSLVTSSRVLQSDPTITACKKSEDINEDINNDTGSYQQMVLNTIKENLRQIEEICKNFKVTFNIHKGPLQEIASTNSSANIPSTASTSSIASTSSCSILKRPGYTDINTIPVNVGISKGNSASDYEPDIPVMEKTEINCINDIELSCKWYNLYDAIYYSKIYLKDAVKMILSNQAIIDEDKADFRFIEKWITSEGKKSILLKLEKHSKVLDDFIRHSEVLDTYTLPIARTDQGELIEATLRELVDKKYLTLSDAMVKFDEGLVHPLDGNQVISYGYGVKSVSLKSKNKIDNSRNFIHSLIRSSVVSATPLSSIVTNDRSIKTGYFYSKNGKNYFRDPFEGITLEANFASDTKHGFRTSLQANNNGLYASSIFSTPNNMLGPWVFYTPGWVGMGLDYAHLFASGNTLSSSLRVFGWDDNLGLAVGAGGIINGYNLGLLTAVVFSKDYQAVWLQQYPKDGEIKSLQGKHQIKVVYKDGKFIRTDLGLTLPSIVASGLGVGTRLAYNRDRIVEHTFWVDDEKKVKEYFKDNKTNILHKLIKVKSIDRILKEIDLYHPLRFQEGEKVKLTVSGGVSGAILVSLSAVTGILASKLGAAKAIFGDFELEVMHLDGKKVLVGLRPTKLESKGVFVEVANTFGTSWSNELLKSIYAQYIFDLSNEDAALAYREFIDYGRLPYLKEVMNLDKIYAPDMNESIRLMGGIQRDAPLLARRGITQTFFSTMISKGNKFKSSIILTPWNIWAKTYLKAHPSVVVTNGEEAAEYRTWQMDVTKETIRSGVESRSVYASVKTFYKLEKNDERVEETSSFPGGIVLRAEFKDSKAIKDDCNLPIREINALFGTTIDEHKLMCQGEKYFIAMERSIRPLDFENLLDRFSFGEGNDLIQEASLRTDIPISDLSQLVSRLNHQGQDAAAVEILHFIHSLGRKSLNGFAAIHILFGGKSKDLIIRSTNSLQIDPVNEANQYYILDNTVEEISREFEGRQNKLPSKDIDKKMLQQQEQKTRLVNKADSAKINQWFKKGRELIKKIENGILSVEDDPLLIKDITTESSRIASNNSEKASSKSSTMSSEGTLKADSNSTATNSRSAVTDSSYTANGLTTNYARRNGLVDLAKPRIENLIQSLQIIEEKLNFDVREYTLSEIKKNIQKLVTIYKNVEGSHLDLLQQSIILYKEHTEKMLEERTASCSGWWINRHLRQQRKLTVSACAQFIKAAEKLLEAVTLEKNKLSYVNINGPINSSKLLSKNSSELSNNQGTNPQNVITVISKYNKEILETRRQRLLLAEKILNSIINWEEFSSEELDAIKNRVTENGKRTTKKLKLPEKDILERISNIQKQRKNKYNFNSTNNTSINSNSVTSNHIMSSSNISTSGTP